MAGKQTKPRNLTGKKLGRPRKVFSGESLERIYEMARNQCYNKTIARVIGCDEHTLEKYLSAELDKARAEGKIDLRLLQYKLAKTSPDMAKFLGKNILGQVDKQEIHTSSDQAKALTEQQEADAAEYLEWWRNKHRPKLAKEA